MAGTVRIEIPVSVQDNTGASLSGITNKLNSMAKAAEKVNRIMVGSGSKKTGIEKSMDNLNRTLSKPHAVEIKAEDTATPTMSEVESKAAHLSGNTAVIGISAEDNASGVMQNAADAVAEVNGATANTEAYGEDNASEVMNGVKDTVASTDGNTANVEAYGEDNASEVMNGVKDAVASTDGGTANVEASAEDNATEVIATVQDALSGLDGQSAHVQIDADNSSGIGGGGGGGFNLPSLGGGGGIGSGIASAGTGIAAAKQGLLGAAGFAGLSLGVGSAIGSYMDFEAGMSQVKAISGADDEDMAKLTAKAQEKGATTKFTASESAEAFNYMAMAGWKTEDMLGGIDGIMDLAAASGESLGTTSDIVTDALTAFGMEAGDAGHFADVMAQASANANTNVGMLGESFKYVGPIAGAMGYSIEDTALALGLMANSGVKASMAGTSLRRAINSLASPTSKQASAMEKYGISLTKENGQMKSLNEIMGDLRTNLGGLSEDEQTAAASAMFGSQAMAGMLAIINASEDDFNSLSDSVNNADGSAKRMADTMLDNLKGSMTLLSSAFEGVQNTLGGRLSPYIRSIVDGLAAEMPKLSDAINTVFDDLEGAFDTGGLMSVGAEIGGGIADIAGAIGESGAEAIKAGETFISGLLKSISLPGNSLKIGSAAAKIVTQFGESFANLSGDYSVAALSLLNGFVTGLAENQAGTKIVEAITNSITEVGDWTSENKDSFGTAAGSLIDQLVSGISENSEKIGNGAAAIVTGLGEGFLEHAGDFGTAALSLIDGFVAGLGEQDAGTKIADAITTSLSDLGNWFGENGGDFGDVAAKLITQLATGISSNSTQIIGAGIQIIGGLAQGLLRGAGVLIGAAPSILLDLIGGILKNIPMLFQAGVELINALKEGLISAGEGLGDFMNDMLTIDPIELNSEINYDAPGTAMMEALQGSMEDTGSMYSSLDGDAQQYFASLANGETTVSELDAAIQEMDPSSIDFSAANLGLQTFIDQVNAFHEAGIGLEEEAASAVEDTGESVKSGAELVEGAMDRVMGATEGQGGLEGVVSELNSMADEAMNAGESMEEAFDFDLADALGGISGDTMTALLSSDDIGATAEQINEAMGKVAETLKTSSTTMSTAISDSMTAMSTSLTTGQEAFTSFQSAAEDAATAVQTAFANLDMGSLMSGASPEVSAPDTGASDVAGSVGASGEAIEVPMTINVTFELGEADPSGVYSQVESDAQTTMATAIATTGTIDVTLAKGTDNIAEVYSSVASAAQSAFNSHISASGHVDVTLSWSITNPTASIGVSVAGGSATATIASAGMAEGGFVDGAELSWIGEDGPEFVIPVGAKRQNRGLDLWMQAGSALGVWDKVTSHADGGAVGNIPVGEGAPAGDGGMTVQVNMSPNFNISGANENDVLALIRANMQALADEFGEELAEMLSEAYENRPVA